MEDYNHNYEKRGNINTTISLDISYRLEDIKGQFVSPVQDNCVEKNVANFNFVWTDNMADFIGRD